MLVDVLAGLVVVLMMGGNCISSAARYAAILAAYGVCLDGSG